ncbi:unnamed protein product, partial [Brenthis ino]
MASLRGRDKGWSEAPAERRVSSCSIYITCLVVGSDIVCRRGALWRGRRDIRHRAPGAARAASQHCERHSPAARHRLIFDCSVLSIRLPMPILKGSQEVRAGGRWCATAASHLRSRRRNAGTTCRFACRARLTVHLLIGKGERDYLGFHELENLL